MQEVGRSGCHLLFVPIGRASWKLSTVITVMALTWEQRVQRHNLKHDTAHPPHVHLVIVVAVSQQALGGTVPAATHMCTACRKTHVVTATSMQAVPGTWERKLSVL